MAKARTILTIIPEAFAVLLLLLALTLGGELAKAQRAQQPVAYFYAAPGAPDNPLCPQAQPCSLQGAVMACQAQWIYRCWITVTRLDRTSDGGYLWPLRSGRVSP